MYYDYCPNFFFFGSSVVMSLKTKALSHATWHSKLANISLVNSSISQTVAYEQTNEALYPFPYALSVTRKKINKRGKQLCKHAQKTVSCSNFDNRF
jgi:hypothetical protein